MVGPKRIISEFFLKKRKTDTSPTRRLKFTRLEQRRRLRALAGKRNEESG